MGTPKRKPKKSEPKDKVQVKIVQWFDDHFYKIMLGKQTYANVLKHHGEDNIPHHDPLQQTIWIPSVTTKLGIAPKGFLAQWRGDIGNREADLRLQEGQQKGSNVHNAWLCMNTGGTVLYNPRKHPEYSPKELAKEQKKAKNNIFILERQEEMYELWKLKRWFDIVQPKIEFSEYIVYSLKTLDAGTMDNLFWIKKGEYCVDGKEPLCLEEGFYVADVKSGKVVSEKESGAQTAAYAKMIERMMGIEVKGTLVIHTNAKTKSGIYGLRTIYSDKKQMDQNYRYYRIMSQAWEVSDLANNKPKVFDFPSSLKLDLSKDKNKKTPVIDPPDLFS